jgi:hypothetical protein
MGEMNRIYGFGDLSHLSSYDSYTLYGVHWREAEEIQTKIARELDNAGWFNVIHIDYGPEVAEILGLY